MWRSSDAAQPLKALLCHCLSSQSGGMIQESNGTMMRAAADARVHVCAQENRVYCLFATPLARYAGGKGRLRVPHSDECM